MSTYSCINIKTEGQAGVITLSRPKQMNALNDTLMDELGSALLAYDQNESIMGIIITGSPKAFAAGADIEAMATWGYAEVYKTDYITRNWETISRIRKPIIAAVSGYALGGGCELAMMCDIIIASETARFGQPEIKLGIIPGAGGSQRLPRAVGKSKAMDMILTARMMNAQEAERAGLVSRVVSEEQLLPEALSIVSTISNYSLPSIMAAKEAVNRAYESSLKEGVLFERRSFHALFATEDQKEGMRAFVDKRPPAFKHR